MSRTVEQMQRRLELILNEIGADQTVFRITLQCFLLNLVAAGGPERLEEMKQQVLATLGNTLPSETDPQGGKRRTQLTILRAEKLFQEIEEAAGLAGNAGAPPVRN